MKFTSLKTVMTISVAAVGFLGLTGAVDGDMPAAPDALPSSLADCSLAMSEQARIEAHAIRLLARPDVQAALAQAETRWRQSAPTSLPANELDGAHAAINELAFGNAMEAINSDPRRPQVLQIFSPPHELAGRSVPGSRYGIENPDTIYFVIPVEMDSSYVITGHRSDNAPIDSNFSYMAPNYRRTISNIGHSDLSVDDGGRYVITVDRHPANGRPNHIQLTDEGRFLFLRNTFADWSREYPDRIAVERISGPEAEDPSSDDELAARTIADTEFALDRLINEIQQFSMRIPANQFPSPGALNDKDGFLSSQRNILAPFALNADQALVATFNPGNANYANFPVSNFWSTTQNYWDHQSSLNMRQAWHNPDGTITVVLSQWDPGIANWVDSTGLSTGVVMMRWQGLSATENTSDEPWVNTRVVSRGELEQAIPESMPRVTAAQRARDIAARRTAVQMRFDRCASTAVTG